MRGVAHRPAEKLAPRVLLVDEDQLLREAVETALHLSRWCVTAACNADEALATFRAASVGDVQPPDLICLDLLHPLDEETRFVKSVRALDTEVPIVGFSAMASDTDWAAQEEVTTLLHKPFSVKELTPLLSTLAHRAPVMCVHAGVHRHPTAGAPQGESR